MKLYRLDKRIDAGVSAGFEFFSIRLEAERAMREWVENPEDRTNGTGIEEFEVEITKPGVLQLLRLYATHPDNG